MDYKQKAIDVHGDTYDYTHTVFDKFKDIVEITCRLHGVFKQRLSDHLYGKGCKKCGYLKIADKCKVDFYKRAIGVHGDRYDYSKVRYTNCHTEIAIICKKHGEFKQRPHNHINGRQGCPICAGKVSYSTQSFIVEANKVHDSYYDYTLTDYNGSKSKVIIECPKHGPFEQTPDCHLDGKGCRKCKITISKPHCELLNYIGSTYTGLTVVNDRNVIKPYEIDIWLPELKLAIEFNGVYFHSFNKKESTRQKNYHNIKQNLAELSQIQLIQINESEWNHKRDIVKSKINYLLHHHNIIIYARCCELCILSDGEYREFINLNHLQGYKSAIVYVGLKHRGVLVSVMSFTRHKKYEWELVRYACKQNTIVIGGASRLLKWFENNYKPSTLLSYADRRYSTGKLYYILGFNSLGITKPNYGYIKRDRFFSRQQFQKHKLYGKLKSFDPALTESDNMFNNGYRRMWDAGNYKFLKTYTSE